MACRISRPQYLWLFCVGVSGTASKQHVLQLKTADRGPITVEADEQCPRRVVEPVVDSLCYQTASAVLRECCLSPRVTKQRVRDAYGVCRAELPFYSTPLCYTVFSFPSSPFLPTSPFASSSSFYFPALPATCFGRGRR